MLNALQVDQADVEHAGLRFTNEEMAAIQVAMVVAGEMKTPGDFGHLGEQPEEIAIARLADRDRMIYSRKTLPQKLIEWM